MTTRTLEPDRRSPPRGRLRRGRHAVPRRARPPRRPRRLPRARGLARGARRRRDRRVRDQRRGPSVAAREKLEVLRALFAADVGVQIVPTVAEATLPATLAMLAALEDLPAAAVMVLPPYFFKPASADGLRAFYEPVVQATRHPVVLYHIPRFSVPIPPEVAGGAAGVGREGLGRGHRTTRRPSSRRAARCSWGPRTTSPPGSAAAPPASSPAWRTRRRSSSSGIYEAVRAGDAGRAAERSARLRAIRDACPGFAGPQAAREPAHGHRPRDGAPAADAARRRRRPAAARRSRSRRCGHERR